MLLDHPCYRRVHKIGYGIPHLFFVGGGPRREQGRHVRYILDKARATLRDDRVSQIEKILSGKKTGIVGEAHLISELDVFA